MLSKTKSEMERGNEREWDVDEMFLPSPALIIEKAGACLYSSSSGVHRSISCQAETRLQTGVEEGGKINRQPSMSHACKAHAFSHVLLMCPRAPYSHVTSVRQYIVSLLSSSNQVTTIMGSFWVWLHPSARDRDSSPPRCFLLLWN